MEEHVVFQPEKKYNVNDTQTVTPYQKTMGVKATCSITRI